MNLNYKQSQFELFPGALEAGEKVLRPRVFFASLTFSLENLIVGLIIVSMAVLLSFSLGVEKGKRIVFKNPSPTASPLPTAAIVPVKNNQPVLKSMPSEAKQEIQKPVIQKTIDSEAMKDVALKDIIEASYTIQVASFKNKDMAQQEATLLKKKGYQIFVLPKGNYSIVCVGKFLKKEQAHGILWQLKKQYKDCLVRRM